MHHYYRKTILNHLASANQHIFLLHHALTMANEIEKEDYKEAFYKLISLELRILVHQGKHGDLPLLFYVANRLKMQRHLVIKRRKHFKSELLENIRLQTYLDETATLIIGEEWSRKKYIIYATNDWGGAHEKEWCGRFVYCEQKEVRINGLTSLCWHLKHIGESVYEAADNLIKEVNKLSEEEIVKRAGEANIPPEHYFSIDGLKN